jgi:Acetyltransferase (GNAT) family
MADWAAEEGWNPGNTDMQAFFAADPGAFLIGRLDGEPVASISVVKYGAGFGFLGFYIVRPLLRGKGYGLQIWRAGMARLEGRNVGLDGVVGPPGQLPEVRLSAGLEQCSPCGSSTGDSRAISIRCDLARRRRRPVRHAGGL